MIKPFKHLLLQKQLTDFHELLYVAFGTLANGILLTLENFEQIMSRTNFTDQIRKVIIRFKRSGCNLNVMRQSACIVINPITVDHFAALFNCTPVDRPSDSMMALT